MGSDRSIKDVEFERSVSLREAYKIMLQFLSDLQSRENIELSWILSAYAGLPTNGSGQSADPAAISDFLKAAQTIGSRSSGGKP